MVYSQLPIILYILMFNTCFILFLLVAYRVYNYSVFTATSVGEGPSADGSFLTREDSELFINCTIDILTRYYMLQYS